MLLAGDAAVGGQLALRVGFGRRQAVAAAADRAIAAGGAVAVGEAGGATLGVHALAVGAAVRVDLALRDAALIGAANAVGSAVVVLVGPGALAVPPQLRWQAPSMQFWPAPHCELATHEVLSAGLGTQRLLSQTRPVPQLSLSTQARWQRPSWQRAPSPHSRLKTQAFLGSGIGRQVAFAHSLPGLQSEAILQPWASGRGVADRLARVTRDVAGIATRAVGPAIAEARLGALAVGGAVAAGAHSLEALQAAPGLRPGIKEQPFSSH